MLFNRSFRLCSSVFHFPSSILPLGLLRSRFVFLICGNLHNLRPIMLAEFDQQLTHTLEDIRSQGLYKTERIITTPQDAHIAVAGGKRVLNMCANNYLGLADHPALINAAKQALDSQRLGMASVRFICGTQDLHKELEG